MNCTCTESSGFIEDENSERVVEVKGHLAEMIPLSYVTPYLYTKKKLKGKNHSIT